MPRLTKKSLRDGLDELAARDVHVAGALEEAGYPDLRRRPAGFRSLLRAIVGQQLSIASAAAIWGRLEKACGEVEAGTFLALSDDDLRAVGFSRQKTGYARSLAGMIDDGTVRLNRLSRLDDEAAISELVQIKGIGRWTAEVYLLSALGRPDIFPADDLALMVGAQYLKNLRTRPDKKRLLKISAPWRPHRTAAAHLLWHYYKHRRDIEADVI